MKLYQIFIFSLILSFSFGACQKYVDIKKSSSQAFIESANDCQLLLDNYDLVNTGYPIDGELSADDYYLDDARYNSNSITIEDRSQYVWQANGIRLSAALWVGPYNKIYHANLILEALEKLKGKEPEQVINNLRGSALFLRAYAHWHVAQLYAKPFSAGAAQDPGIPVHLKSDINDGPDRGTVKQTYDQILKDLNEAAPLINVASSIASRPNRGAVYAMLARVYLSMDEYSSSLASATAALAIKNDLIDFNTLSKTSFTPFARFNKEVIFHSVIFNQNAVLEPGYGDEDLALIDPSVISSYGTGDLRKQILFKLNSDVQVPHDSYRFTGNYEGAVGSAKLFNGLTTDELYVTRAECYARAGSVDLAMADLNTLLRSRWLAGTYVDLSAANADQALSLVLAERRKELIMRGTRWTDLRRLNKDTRFSKVLTRIVEGKTYTLPPNDPRYTLLIPQEVITNSRLIQNSR